MNVLFEALHFGYYRNLESVIRFLAQRGHAVHLAAERDDSAIGGRSLVEALAAAYPNVTCGDAPKREDDTATFVAAKVRLGLDYLRYLEPPYDRTPALRERSEDRVSQLLVKLAARGPFASTRRRTLAHLLRGLELAAPPSPAIERFLQERRPDVLVVTPLIGVVASSQLDYVRAATALRIPTALAVWSWDHLSSKALIRDAPDRVLVWNDTQRREAVEMHGVPPERVVVTGAQNFDRWFDRGPSRPRADFGRLVGLRDDRPFLLWVCSALFRGSPSEAAFVERWVEHVRASADDRLRTMPILVRPHPSRQHEWEGVDLARHGDVALYGGNPIDERGRNDYFDSLFYSAAVVGLNTSAFIEAGIAQRPVLAIMPPEFRENQEGTIHFEYLRTVGGGLLTTSRSLEEHAAQLVHVLGERAEATLARQRGFFQAFVRPHGLDVPATPAFAEALESLAATRVTASSPAVAPGYARWLFRRLMAVAADERKRMPLLDRREARAAAAFAAKRRAADDARARKAAIRAEKASRVR